MRSSRLARVFALTAIVLGSSALGGCIYLPRTTTSYDAKCQFYGRHMTLEVEQAAFIAGCAGEACVAALALFGIVSAASAVVSGSVVVVGNIVYWLEKQTQCMGKGDRSTEGQSEQD